MDSNPKLIVLPWFIRLTKISNTIATSFFPQSLFKHYFNYRKEILENFRASIEIEINDTIIFIQLL